MTWSSSCSTWLSAADDCREPCVFCSMLWSSHVAFMLLSTVSGRWSMMRLYKRNRAYKNIKCIFNDAPSTRQPIVEHTLCWTHSFFAGHGSIVVLQVFFTYVVRKLGEGKNLQCRPISTSMPPVETKFQRLPFSRSMQQSNGTTWNILYDQTGSGIIQDCGRRCGNIYMSACRRDSNEISTAAILDYFPLPVGSHSDILSSAVLLDPKTSSATKTRGNGWSNSKRQDNLQRGRLGRLPF